MMMHGLTNHKFTKFLGTKNQLFSFILFFFCPLDSAAQGGCITDFPFPSYAHAPDKTIRKEYLQVNKIRVEVLAS
jgi:hypothetical protein